MPPRCRPIWPRCIEILAGNQGASFNVRSSEARFNTRRTVRTVALQYNQLFTMHGVTMIFRIQLARVSRTTYGR
jgi:heme/copper-type cytochrome/quinol oxidase subunit 1